MTRTCLTLTIVAAAFLATQGAFAAEHQTRTSVARKVASNHPSLRQAYGAVRSHDATIPAAAVAVARPPAQPGAW
jgi:hypothetical protein